MGRMVATGMFAGWRANVFCISSGFLAVDILLIVHSAPIHGTSLLVPTPVTSGLTFCLPSLWQHTLERVTSGARCLDSED